MLGQSPAPVAMFQNEFDDVYRSLRLQGLSEADAEDLAQDVFLTAWRRWPSYDPRRPLRAWLAGMAIRAADRHAGRREREEARGRIDPRDERPTPEDHALAARQRSLVLELLGALSPREAPVVVAHDVESVPMQAIAERLGIPLPTAYTRLRAGRRKFARLWRRRATIADAKAALAIHWRDEEDAAPEVTRDR